MAYLLSVSALPYMLAETFETTGSYRLGLWICVGLNLISVITLLNMGPYTEAASRVRERQRF